MAVKSNDGLTNNLSQSYNSTNSVNDKRPPYCCVKINFSADQSTCSTTSKCRGRRHNRLISPYLVDGFHTTAKEKPLSKKHPSSFPLAMNIYKANSDELNIMRRGNKKVKKSVLTLPNNPAPLPQVCTVSDMNDSEYFDQKAKKRVAKPKKRSLQSKKHRVRTKKYEYYDRDARYCAQLNIDLDRSSTEIINYNGDTKRKSQYKHSLKKLQEDNSTLEAHNVWAILRNINRFQFQQSPPMSEESILLPKKKRGFKHGNNHKDARVIETCHTEEIAYVTSYEIDRKSRNTYSPSSSTDRITVIDKQNDISKIYGDFGGMLDSNNVQKEFPKPRKQVKNDSKMTRVKVAVPPKITAHNHNHVGHAKKRIQQRKPIKDDIHKINFDHNSATSDHTSFTSNGNRCTISQERTVDCNTSYSSLAPPDLGNDFIISNGKRIRKLTSPQFKGISKVVVSKMNEAVHEQKPNLARNRPKKRLSIAVTNTVTSAPIEIQTENVKKDFSVQSSHHDSAEMPHEAATNTEVASCHCTPKELPNHYSPNSNKRLSYYDKAKTAKPIITDMKKSTDKLTNAENPKTSFVENYRLDTPIHKTGSIQLISEQKQNMSLLDMIKLNHTRDRELTLKHAKVRPKNLNQTRTDKQISTNLPANDLTDMSKEVPKKPRILFKDRMLNFLHRQSSSNVSDDPYRPANISSASRKTIDVKVDVQSQRPLETHTTLRSDSVKPIVQNDTLRMFPKQRWAKAKRASDFIENVIKKIKNGVYYTQDIKKSVEKDSSVISLEPSIETVTSIKSGSDATSDRTKCEDALAIMSNNNNALSAIEIRTLNSNQIAIKHCVTNVVLQFDVTIPSDSSQVLVNTKTSSTLIPLDSTESQSQIFKSKMTIVNAVLPAELCTIMPKMIRSFFDSNGKPTLPLHNYPLGLIKPEKPALSTIKEVISCEAPNPLKCLTISLYLSPKVKRLLEGGFANNVRMRLKSPVHKVFQVPHYRLKEAKGMLRKVSTKILLIESDIKVVPMKLPVYNQLKGDGIKSLVPYTCVKNNITPAFRPYNFANFVQNVMKNKNLLAVFRPIASINELRILYDGHNITVTMSVNEFNGDKKQMTLSVKNVHQSLFRKEMNVDDVRKYNKALEPELKCMPVKMNKGSRSEWNHSESLDCTVRKYEHKVHSTVVNKYRKKGFRNLYRKCKSSSYVSAEKGCTPLDKINTLHDFLQILGSNKWLFTVFDDCVISKILSSLLEMRNWITVINPRQAFLVLLLTTKKDTANLVRFKPILLQGIAVNRITKVSELDMEIEVIENENFQKFSQYEGIPCLPMSTECYDNLMEELYWIAKTTASDYQKPFDDSSVRLLNSLLEKRKKLNPSYLRVMARYVGLGLLKSPTKK